jgi:hypothetical protein
MYSRQSRSKYDIPYGLLTLYAKKSPIGDEQTNEIAKKGNLAILPPSLSIARARLLCRVSPNRRARRSVNLERLYVTERKTPTEQGRGGRKRGQERSDGKRCHAGWSLARHGIYGGQHRRQEE